MVMKAKIMDLYLLKITVKQQSHISVSVKRALGVLKNCKIPHTPDTRRRHVRNALRVRCVRLVYVRRASLYVAKNHRAFRARLGSTIF